jgi:uncharacterized UBP type Zn finger protein
MAERCTHLDQIQPFSRRTDGCEECLELGETWLHLRQCLICGHVGCCSDSKNNHAEKHSLTTTHPLMRSLERGDDWMWCYVDEVMIEPAP